MENNIKQDLEEQFTVICDLSRKYNSEKGAIRSSEPRGRKIVNRLTKFAETIHAQLSSEMQSFFTYQISKGQSNIPKIIWVSLVPRGRSVSESASVTMCFGTSGEGSVAGIMDAVTYPQGLFKPTKRLIPGDDINLGVNIDGAKPNSKYNNKFFNPLEFLERDFDAFACMKHINDSVELLNKRLTN